MTYKPSYLQHEKQYTEDPFLETLEKLGWKIIKLKGKGEGNQTPGESFRENFSQVILKPKLEKALKKINPFLEQDQINDVIRRLTNHQHKELITENQRVLNLLLQNTSVAENRKTKEKSPTVKYIDFKDKKNNYYAISQFKVRIKGTEKHIYPDITLFINGLPIAVIECKSPREKGAISKGINQLLRYSEQRNEKNEGNKKLFYYNQILVSTCRNQAKFGTISSHSEKYFFRWTDPYPYKLSDIKYGSPNDQERLIYGMFTKNNLLDLIKKYTIFKDEEENLIKIVARYQQFRAVKKIIKKLKTGKNKEERGGIIWHTQGSGKSLTMMFTIREMYQDNDLKDWKVIFVTDRRNLEKQLKETATKAAGFTIKLANNINKLKELIKSDNSDLIMAMIHKFREKDFEETFPILNKSNKILIMTDEAHRTQYSKLGANFNKSMPNATQIGYTGTPIEKTEKKYRDYIDKYSMKQAIKDKVILKIVYEGKTHKGEIKNKEEMDKKFIDLFPDYTNKELKKIIGKNKKRAYFESKEIIKKKSKDMIDHYVSQVFPNGLKAQIVTISREAAVRYKKYIDQALKNKIKELTQSNPNNININLLKKLKSCVIISKNNQNDEKHLEEYTNSKKQDNQISEFKKKFNIKNSENIGIIIVNSMLLTGFDAPIEQVMYLDKVIRDHNLLQAVARVNRIGPKEKECGFVVDYSGTGNHLKEALDIYEEKEKREILDSFSNIDQEINELKYNYEEIIKYINKQGIKNLEDYDAFYDLFCNEKIRFEFNEKFKKFSKSLNKIFPNPEGLDYLKDYKKLLAIQRMSNQHIRTNFDLENIPNKIREITDEYVKSKGIIQKVKPIEITDKDFKKDIKKLKTPKTKAAAIEHAIRDHISEHYDEDPDLYISYSEELEKIFKENDEKWEEIYRNLERLREKINNSDKENTFGLNKKTQMPFFRTLKKQLFNNEKLSENNIKKLVNLTQLINQKIKNELSIPNFWNNPPAINRLEGEIQEILLNKNNKNIPNIFKKKDKIITRFLEIAEKNNDIILYSD